MKIIEKEEHFRGERGFRQFQAKTDAWLMYPKSKAKREKLYRELCIDYGVYAAKYIKYPLADAPKL